MKKIFHKLLIMLILASIIIVPVSVHADEQTVTVKVNFTQIPLKNPAVNRNGITMVPVCEFSQIMWYEVSWNLGDNKFRMYRAKSDKDMIWQMDSDIVNVNGEDMHITGTPQVINDVVYIPLRAFCDAAGLELEWDSASNAACFYTDTKEIMEKMELIDDWCNQGVLDFVLNLYDPETGLFHYCMSARDYEQFGPGIESTSQCLGLLEKGKPFGFTGNFYDFLPQEYKDKTIKTLQSWQSEEDGYFYVPWQKKSQTDAKRERDLTNALNVLTKLGGKPLYMTPGERLALAKSNQAKPASSTSIDAIPEQYKSEEAMLRWLNNLNWASPYSALHQISASFSTIKAAGFGDMVRDYVTAKQNPDTGLWGDEVNYDATDAGLKAVPLYNKEHPFPNFEKMVYSTLQALKENKNPDNVCIIWNPLSLLVNAIGTYNYKIPQDIRDIIHENLPDIIETTYNNLQPYKKADGGLSYRTTYTPHKAQSSNNGLGLAEGNADHTVIGTFLVRNSLLELANYSILTPVFENQMDRINETLLSNEPVVKKERVIGCDKDFEDCTPGGQLPWDVISNCVVGEVSIAKDPYRENNTVLKMDKVPGGETGVTIIAQTYDDSSKITLECDMLVESYAKGSSAYNEIGDLDGVQWCFTSPDGITWSFARRNNQAGVGTVMKTGLKMKQWYRLKIVYEPKGTDDTQVTYYVNGEIVDRTNQYYNGDKATALPAKRIERITFHPFQAANGVLYFDNVKVTAER